MPWTFAHPAAVLPLKRLCPRYLSLPALFVGSLTPDFSYYINNPFDVGSITHTVSGSVLVCLPAGLLLLLLFYAMRQPVWFLLPARHRHAIAPLGAIPFQVDARFTLVTTISLLLGVWTHTVWDSFTHRRTWVVNRLAPLREPWISVGSVEFAGYSVLQHLSTLVGMTALGLAYFLWLRKQPRAHFSGAGDGWRYLVVLSVPIASFGLAIFLAIGKATGPTGVFDAHAFVFKTAIYSMSTLLLLLFIYSIFYHVAVRSGSGRSCRHRCTPSE